MILNIFILIFLVEIIADRPPDGVPPDWPPWSLGPPDWAPWASVKCQTGQRIRCSRLPEVAPEICLPRNMGPCDPRPCGPRPTQPRPRPPPKPKPQPKPQPKKCTIRSLQRDLLLWPSIQGSATEVIT